MIFRVLGCSGSESDRTHPCSFLIGDALLVDMGSAASRLTIEEQVAVRDIVLSHAHLDHTKDVAFFAENVFSRISKSVNVRGTAETLRKVREHLMNGELWPDFAGLPSQANAILRYEAFEERSPFRIGDLEILAVPVNHPGGCVGLFFSSPQGTILYSGDTGPTDAVWEEVNRRGVSIRAILLETSFPNRLGSVADASGHLTPKALSGELGKIRRKDIPVFIYHLKAPYRDETLREIDQLGDPRIRVLEAGMRIEF